MAQLSLRHPVIKMPGVITLLLSVGLSLPHGREAPPLLEGLGRHEFKVTSGNPEARKYFNQGLALLYAFNHDEAIRSFRHAVTLDPQCAIAWWGIAHASGPHINNPALPPDRAASASAAVRMAREHAAGASPIEKALIEAIGHRFAEIPADDRGELDRAYAAAMKKAFERYPDDADVGALYAESLMNLRPWDLWDNGKPQPGTLDLVAALEAVIKRHPSHPFALHLYIHAVEASPNPEKGDAAAERLRDACPGLGHLVHMPSHIDIRRGRWKEGEDANMKAIAADRRYAARSPEQGFYRIYMAHNYHMLTFARMMRGDSKLAAESAQEMLAGIPEAWLSQEQNAAIADGVFATPAEVMMRFGQWDELLKLPEPPERFPLTRALVTAFRGIAFAAKDRVPEARAAQIAFRKAAALVPADRSFGNNAAADLLAIGDDLLEGEILLREGKLESGLAALRSAVSKEDALRYDEPPDWIQPVRHALGAWLVKAGMMAEAEQVYREDLRRWPDNGWSLFGLATALEAQGRRADAARARKAYESMWAPAGISLASSCFCQAPK